MYAPVHADELADRARIENEVTALLFDENFSKLEATADAYRTSKSRTSSGLWHLTFFYIGISEAFNMGPKFWGQHERIMEKWLAQYPKSPTAILAYSLMLSRHAWNIRGAGFSSSVRPENWKPFEEYIERARVYLEKNKTIASKDPKWYEQMIEFAKIQAWSENDFEKLIAEAIDLNPQFYQLYFVAIDYYVPKWHGDSEAVEKFARRMLKKTRSTEGFGMYARIYWYASQTQYGDDLFSESLVDWPTMKKGIDDVLKKYPDNWNINNFAKFACLHGDKAKTAMLMAKISEPILNRVWRHQSNFDNCKVWSSGLSAATESVLQRGEYVAH